MADAARAMVAIHGTDVASMYLQACVRLQESSPESIGREMFETRSVLRVLAMRRTLFLVPVDEVATLHAAASLAVGRRERERTLAMFAAGGVGPDTAAHVRRAGADRPRRGAGTGRGDDRGADRPRPSAGPADRARGGQVVRRLHQRVPEGVLPSGARWVHRPGSPARLVDRVAGALESHRAVAAGRYPADADGRGPGPPRRPVAAGLRTRHARGPSLVDRLDGGRGARGARRQRCDRGGSRRRRDWMAAA